MRRIAILNQKGGVGKTTTTVNLAAALAANGRRAGILDLDPQAHATTHLGLELDGTTPSLYDVLVNNKPLASVRREADQNLAIYPSSIDLAAAEVELAGVVGREVILKEALAQHDADYDFLLMDCGPSLGVLSLNALAAADEVFIPLQPHFLALHGLSKLLETTALVARRINPRLRVTGVVICQFESQTKLAHEVIGDLKAFLDIGKSIFRYAPNCPGATDYAALANEVVGHGIEQVETPPAVSEVVEPQPIAA
jgi:chromosome partitioning protein